jgi:proteasome lid subunit RPN8/RPN11
LRDQGPTEVGAFGLAPADDLLYVEELRLVGQQCTAVSVCFDDTAIAEFFDEQVERGRTPEQFARIWIHTHPGGCPLPSQVDEETFARVFGRCDWSVMFILAKEGQTYCRLQFSQGPGAAFEIPASVDFKREFPQSDREAWSAEFDATVIPEPFRPARPDTRRLFLEDAELFASEF